MRTIRPHTSGYLLVVVLVFSSVFITILTSFVTFVIVQSRLIEQRIQLEQAGQISEAGLNYYKWYLAHNPNDTTNGTGTAGPYIGVYSDPEGGPIGEYSLAVASTTYCGAISSIQVNSTGYTYKQPNVIRTLSARYARPNVAEFSFILNSNVWAGSDRIITGPYHSNGGIRMDATHNSSVTSGQANWQCNPTFGCTPTSTRDGVFTTSGNATPALFATSTANVSFGGITTDLTLIKDRAQNGGGLFFPHVSSGPGTNYGYQVRFNSNNTVSVSRVTSVLDHWGYTTEAGWVTERNIILATTSVGTYTVPVNCPVIYIEDKVWLSGVVAGKATIAAAHATSSSINPSVILQGNITYVSATSSGLLAIAEQDVLIGVDVPDTMYINGIYIAKNGKYGRNFYCYSSTYCTSTYRLPVTTINYRNYAFRDSEIMNGTVVSNGRVGTQWTNSSGVTTSGFDNRITSYDRNLVESPPPFIPNTSDVYEFSDWRDAN